MAKKDKLDLKTPDVFHTTSDKIFIWIEEHARTVISVVAAGVVLSLVIIGVNYFAQRREAKAAEAIYQPEDALKKIETRVREERQGETTRVKSAEDKKKPVAKPLGFAAEFGPAVDALEARLKEFPGTRVALVSALNLSYFLMQEKQPARAMAVLDLVTYRPGSSDLLGGFWHMHRGLALIEAKKFKEATEAYQAVLAQKALVAFHPEALLKLGLTKDLEGDVNGARDAYQKVGREYPGTEASGSAQNFLRLLGLKAQKG